VTALTTESRGLLVTALTGHGFKVYGTAPAIPVTPSIVIVPDAPWITPERIGGRLNYRVRWKLLVVINPRKNDAASVDTEDAVDVVLGLMPSGFTVDQVGPPSLTDLGAQGTVITTEINVQAHMKES
jgi:hypothetical protein